MNEDMATIYKEMISRYIDDECTPEEREFVKQLLEENRALFDYYQQLKGLDTVLNEHPVEETSSDWEQQVRASMRDAHAREEKKMTTNTFRITVGGGVLAGLIICIILAQTYAQRGMQARLRDASVFTTAGLKTATDDIGDQFSAGSTKVAKIMSTRSVSNETFITGESRSQLARSNAQYEPYYLESQYQVDRIEPEVKELAAKTPGQYPATAPQPTRTRVAGGFQQSVYGGAAGYEGYAPAEEVIAYGGKDERDAEFWGGRADQGKAKWDIAHNTEEYSRIYENEFLAVADNPLSTFSIDVDTGSYSNIRRFLNAHQLPPADAVRIEEMLNYFSYNYAKPEGDAPFSINIDGAVAPWNNDHHLVRIGLQGKTLAEGEIPPSNLVFLIDVSGSMEDPNKLPLLKDSLKMMVKQLSSNERVAIVVYAGNAGLVLESTPGSDKRRILDAIDRLQAGGSTAGGAGIQLAYKIAKENFIKGGNNRVILATDGDFNVGVSSTAEMIRLIEEKREDGIFVTVLGFGMGNYKDGRLEQIANKGNGTYHYIDTQNEARKVMVEELGSTLFTIAKDVKIQIEFNPAQVKAYRLIGYENRVLAKEDFNDDKKDAGELGAGHTVTALYEIVPATAAADFGGKVDPLKYQQTRTVDSSEIMTVKLRYKQPDGFTSKLLTETVTGGQITAAPEGDFGFAAAVAEFGMLLRQSKFMGESNYRHVIQAAEAARGTDEFGYRQEFIDLVKIAASIDQRPQPLFEEPVYPQQGPEEQPEDFGETQGLRFKN